jgi:hypothetical protein
VIGGRAGGLDEKDILAAHVLVNFDKGFAVGKGTHGAFANFHAASFGDRFSQGAVGRAAKNFHRRSVFRGKIKATVLVAAGL